MLDLEMSQMLIAEECDAIKEMLLAKNRAYGNSFAEPMNIYSKATAMEQINNRIDDKLSRIKHGVCKENVPEDTDGDFIGYLILRRVLMRYESWEIGRKRRQQENEGLQASETSSDQIPSGTILLTQED